MKSNGLINYKGIVKQEYAKCLNDPIYFMKNYCLIQHPIKGKIKFNLYDFQEKTLKDLEKHRLNIILKSRQLGISTLTAGYSLWLMTFHSDKNILVIAINQGTAINLVTKVRVMYNGLPSWLKEEPESDNRMSLRFKNGSQIKAVSSSPNSARSESLSLLILDEAGYLEHIDEIWASSHQTLATGGRCIALSTPNGIGNWFHKTWVKAESGENNFNFIKLPWYIHPERNQEWRDRQNVELGKKIAAQECDCDFLTSGDTVIESEILIWLKNNFIKEPIEKRYSGKLWIWKYPEPNKSYIVSADVARGDGGDYSAFHILDVDTLEQIAEYKDKISTDAYGNLLVNVSNEYNQALLVVENASIGWAVIQTIIDRRYSNLYYTQKDFKYIDIKSHMKYTYEKSNKDKMTPGFTTSSRTRPLLVEKLERMLSNKNEPVLIKSSRLIDELFVFKWNNRRKAEASKGYNDDLVMSYMIGLWIRETAIKLRKKGIQYTKQSINKMNKSKYEFNGHNSGAKKIDNQWNLSIDNKSNWNLKELL